MMIFCVFFNFFTFLPISDILSFSLCNFQKIRYHHVIISISNENFLETKKNSRDEHIFLFLFHFLSGKTCYF